MNNRDGSFKVFPGKYDIMDPENQIHRILWLGSIGGGEPRTGEYTGVKALMLAVLADGIQNYCGPPGRLRTEAEAWAYSDKRAAFSFIVICETLGLEPDAVRRALPRLQRESSDLGKPRRLRGNSRSHVRVAK